MAATPQSCTNYQDDYHTQAWEGYTLAELGQWVHLFTKRAQHRTNFAKKDKDLLDAQNYLNMMQAKLDAEKEVTLEKFASVILTTLTKETNVELVEGTTDNVTFVDWKIRDDDPIKGFDDAFKLYIRPALLSLVNHLNECEKVFELEIIPINEREPMGSRQSVVKSHNMAARFTTSYDSDGGGGKNSGIVMVIEVAAE